MRNTLLATLLVLAFSSRAQDITRPGWKVGAGREAHGHSVIRVKGKNSWRSIVNIEFETPDEIRARDGGVLSLYVAKKTPGAANLDNFMVVVEDMQGNELFRKEMEAAVASSPNRYHLWWNMKMIFIRKKLPESFKILIIDRLMDTHTAFFVHKSVDGRWTMVDR